MYLTLKTMLSVQERFTTIKEGDGQQAEDGKPALLAINNTNMKTAHTYNLIKQLLTDYPALRDSDKKLYWSVCTRQGRISNSNPRDHGFITYYDFLNAPSTETIRRCRQKIQELHPELQSSKRIRKFRQAIAEQKGTYIFRDQMEII
jgi:hypothetical protein